MNPMKWAKKIEFSSTSTCEPFMILSPVMSKSRIIGALLTFNIADKRKIKHTISNIIVDLSRNDSHTKAAMLYRQNEKEALDIETGL
jgi:hypothetical protein